MLTDFFLKLREGGVPASVKEYLTLMEALQKRVSSGSLDEFYYLSRACLVKDESNYDKFDRVFGAYFKGIAALPDGRVVDIPAEWLRRQAELLLTEQEKKLVESLGGWEKLIDTLRKRLRSKRAGTRAGRNGSEPAAARRSAPTATTRRACASDRRAHATAAP